MSTTLHIVSLDYCEPVKNIYVITFNIMCFLYTYNKRYLSQNFCVTLYITLPYMCIINFTQLYFVKKCRPILRLCDVCDSERIMTSSHGERDN